MFVSPVLAQPIQGGDKSDTQLDQRTINEITTNQYETRFSCDGKRTCRQMSSCEEATFYLRQCHRTSLDRDGDGIPCESICR